FAVMLTAPDRRPTPGGIVTRRGPEQDVAKDFVKPAPPVQFDQGPDIMAVAQNVKPGPIEADSMGMKLVQIPPGEFVMGSPTTEQGHQGHEGPQHRVRITSPFWMSRYETTYGNFRAFVKATGHNSLGAGQPWETPGRWVPQNDDPVVNVSWNDADA